LAHSDKIALQVAEGMLHASNCLATLRKVEGCSTFLATRNAIIAVAKWGVTRTFFLATCNAAFVALQVARKNSRVTPHFATAIIALRVASKVERRSTFRNVARQVACV